MARKNLEIVNKYINEEEHNETTEASQYDEKKKVREVNAKIQLKVNQGRKLPTAERFRSELAQLKRDVTVKKRDGTPLIMEKTREYFPSTGTGEA